jgi:CheY-like chemotaxis protein
MAHNEKPRVLIVDDNEATCTLITALLQREFAVETASDGVEAIDKLRTNSYSAILLDLRMPQTDGFAVLDFLKQNSPDLLPNVLVVTASLTRGEIERARGYGVCGIVTKPFEVEILLAAVKECAGPAGDGSALGNVIASTPVLLLLADLLKQRLM